MAYVLDSNVFIEAKNRHYGFDFCPGFWDWLERANAAKTVFSVARVGEEITRGGDDLAKWAKSRRASFFLLPDAAVVSSMQVAARWATAAGFDPAAVSTFLQAADYYLVAHAHAHSHTVVTHEVAAPTTKRIKIPNACAALGVVCTTPFEMLRSAGARLILGP